MRIQPLLVVSRARLATASCRQISQAMNLPPLRFLRDWDEQNFDPITQQRTDVSFHETNGKPTHNHQNKDRYTVKDLREEEGKYVIDWADGVTSKYSKEWISKTGTQPLPEISKRHLWTNLTEEDVRESSELSMHFNESIQEGGIQRAIQSLYKFGILLVTDTPIDDNGASIAALSSAVSGSPQKDSASSILTSYQEGKRDTIVLPNGTDGPLRTLYGNVWFTKSSIQSHGTSVADSAYTSDSLPLHTDMTYMLSPPGLQIFTMMDPALDGGESVYCDGFAAAEILKAESPSAFKTLSSVVRTYHCVDVKTGWSLQANGPVIETTHGNVVVRIRHNDLDRLPDLPTCDFDCLAEAHARWDEILARDSSRLVMKLRKGDTMIVANQRCMHGRHSFELRHGDERAVSGCYVSQDELASRFRMEGYTVGI